MHRKDGTEDFDRTWKEYEAGFGNVNGEFWFGKIHSVGLNYPIKH